MFDDVLVLLDGSPEAARAVGPAAAIARYLEATLFAVGFHQGPTRHLLATTIEDQLRGWGQVRSKVVVEPRTGTVGQSLTEVLDDHPKALICLSTHGRGRSAALVGSVASEVLDVARGPVLLVGPRYEAPSFRCHGPLVVAVNGSDQSHSILPTAQTFASHFDYDLEIATVVNREEPSQFEQLQAMWNGPRDRPGAAHRTAAEAESQVEVPVSFTVLHGDSAAAALIDHATRAHAAVLAMASHNPSGLDRVVTGSTLANVARGAPCPVLAVKSVH